MVDSSVLGVPGTKKPTNIHNNVIYGSMNYELRDYELCGTRSYEIWLHLWADSTLHAADVQCETDVSDRGALHQCEAIAVNAMQE